MSFPPGFFIALRTDVWRRSALVDKSTSRQFMLAHYYALAEDTLRLLDVIESLPEELQARIYWVDAGPLNTTDALNAPPS